jgi:ankyrin repeat protein
MLVAHGARVNVRNKSGATPLHTAALGGDSEVVKLLLDHGAEINARDQESGATPLSYAASLGRGEVVELLLARGADLTLRNTRGQTPLDLAEENNQKEISDLLRLYVGK